VASTTHRTLRDLQVDEIEGIPSEKTPHPWDAGSFPRKVLERGLEPPRFTPQLLRKWVSSFIFSAASAANAVVDTVRDLITPTRGDFHSVCVLSKGEYGTPAGLITSLPIKVDAVGKWRVVEGIKLNDYAKAQIQASNDELLEERKVAFGQLGLSV